MRPLDVLDGWYGLPVGQTRYSWELWRKLGNDYKPTGNEVVEAYRVDVTHPQVLTRLGDIEAKAEGRRVFRSGGKRLPAEVPASEHGPGCADCVEEFRPDESDREPGPEARRYRAADAAARRAIKRLEDRGYLERVPYEPILLPDEKDLFLRNLMIGLTYPLDLADGRKPQPEWRVMLSPSACLSPDPPNPRPDSAAGTRKQVPL